MKDGPCATDARDPGHGGIVKISDPDTHGDIGGEAEAPIVSKIRGSAGFDGAGKRKAENGILSEGP